MAPNLKRRVEQLLESKLTPEQRKLWQLVAIEVYKDKVLFRMPAGVVSLETVWQRVKEIMEEAGIQYTRSGTFATLDELDNILSNINWLWKGWLPEGFNTLLAGDPGVGKSALALDWAARVTLGKPWPLQPAKDDGKPGNVIWIETEASQQILNVRAKALGIDRKRVFLPVIDGDIMGQPDIGNEEHREQIVNLIEAKKPKLIVLDSLGSAHSRGENRKEDIAPVLEFFAMIARDYSCGALIIHHLNKMSANESPEVSLYRVRGSTAIPALSRSVIALDRPQDDKARINVIKSNLAARKSGEIAVLFRNNQEDEIVGMDYEPYTAPPPKKTKKEQCAEWVMAQIVAHGGEIKLKDLTELGEAEGYTRGNLYAGRDVLGDRIAVGGTGNSATWHVANDRDAERQLSFATRKDENDE